jgi:3-oxoacyl-[acyl-carrier-protein] synthase III
MPTRYARLASIGSALPERSVPNSFFESYLDTSDEWIRDRTGIGRRWFAGPGENTSSLAVDSARTALERAGWGPESVDMLIVATYTPDRLIPSTAATVQAELGMMPCPAFDLNAACAGWVYGLSLGTAVITAGQADRVMVVGSEVQSRILNMQDRTTCVLFGDGAGTVLLEPSDEPGVIDSILALDGTQSELLVIPAGATREPASAETVAANRHTLRMSDGAAVFRQAVVSMANACSDLLAKADLSIEDVDLVIPHQANARIIAAVAKRLGVPDDRVVVDVEDVGNTSAASIPIAIDRTWRAGRLAPGSTILTVAFGAGLAWGANLVRWTADAPRKPAGGRWGE